MEKVPDFLKSQNPKPKAQESTLDIRPSTIDAKKMDEGVKVSFGPATKVPEIPAGSSEPTVTSAPEAPKNPNLPTGQAGTPKAPEPPKPPKDPFSMGDDGRSEERRVGKECRL